MGPLNSTLFWMVWGTTLGMGLGLGGLVTVLVMLHRRDPGLHASPEPDNSKRRQAVDEGPPPWREEEDPRPAYPPAWEEVPPLPKRRTTSGADTMDVLGDGYRAAHAAGQSREPGRRSGPDTGHYPPYYPAPPAGPWQTHGNRAAAPAATW